MAVWTFSLSAVYLPQHSGFVRTANRVTGTVTKVDGSPVTVMQSGSVVPRVTTSDDGAVSFTIDRTNLTGAPEVIVDFGFGALHVKADEYGDYLSSVASTGTSDSAVAAIVNNTSSTTRASLDGRYAAIRTLDAKGPGRNTDALRYFRSQLARRESTPVDMVFIGHSLVEGEGATAMSKRWTDRLRDTLRSRFPVAGVAGGYGFVPIQTHSTTWNLTGISTVSGGATSALYGLGYHSYFVNASGAFARLESITCTAVDVLYTQGGGGTFSTKVDGVANGDSKATTGSPVQLMKYRVPGISGAAAPHTVEVDYVSGNSIILGFMVYNQDETKGIRTWNSGHGGATSTTLTDPSNVKVADLATINPALVTIMNAANDYKDDVNPTTHKANTQALISQIRAKAPNASIVLMIEHALGNTGTVVYPWTQYVQNYYDVADADGKVAVFDLYQRLGTQVPPTVPGIIAADQQHYTNDGQLMVADAFAKFLEP